MLSFLHCVPFPVCAAHSSTLTSLKYPFHQVTIERYLPHSFSFAEYFPLRYVLGIVLSRTNTAFYSFSCQQGIFNPHLTT